MKTLLRKPFSCRGPRGTIVRGFNAVLIERIRCALWIKVIDKLIEKHFGPQN